MARYTPPTEEQKATAEMVGTLAADLRPGAARTSSTQQEAPSTKASQTPEGPVEVAGIRVADPKLGGVLAELWAAMERREPHES